MLFTGNGTKGFLRDDGQYASSLVVLGSTYTGSLVGVKAKFLLLYCDGINANDITNLNNVITSLGGTTSNIVINFLSIGNGGTTYITPPAYDSTNDAVLYWDFSSSSNSGASSQATAVTNLLNQYYNNNKGVLYAPYGSSNNNSIVLNLAKNISTFSGTGSASIPTHFPQSSIQQSSHMILNSVSDIYNNHVGSMSTLNGSTGIGNINNSNAVNYLDDLYNVYGRRVDLHMYIDNVLSNDSGPLGGTRCILQSLLWAGRKFV